MAVLLACLEAGDTFMGLNLDHGGHLSHGSLVNSSGILYKPVGYNLSRETGMVDYDEMEQLARQHKPKLLIAGGSAYSREWDYERMRTIADEVGAIFMVDMAHPAGRCLNCSTLPYSPEYKVVRLSMLSLLRLLLLAKLSTPHSRYIKSR